MKPKTIIISIFLLFSITTVGTTNLKGQSVSSIEISTQKQTKFDTTYIKSYYNDLIIGLSLPQKNVDFSLTDVQNEQELLYQINTKASIGFKASYKWISLTLGIGIPHTRTQVAKYGKTERLDLQINMYLRKLVIDGYLQYYKGFYLYNMDRYFEGFSELDLNYYQRPDLTFTNVGLSVRYIKNNKKFSYKSSYDFNEKQKKRAGSLLLGGYAFLNGATADSLVVPGFAQSSFSEKGLFSNIVALNLGFSIGYVYTFVILDNFFMTLGILPGVGLQTYTTSDNQENIVDIKNGLGISYVGRFSLGYSKNRFYTALSGVNGSNNLFNKDQTAINFGYSIVRFTIGYRFTLKKKLF